MSSTKARTTTRLAVKAKTKTVPNDVAEQLRTAEEVAAYLDAWFKEQPEDATGIACALGDIGLAPAITQVTREAGARRTSLYNAERERKPKLLHEPRSRLGIGRASSCSGCTETRWQPATLRIDRKRVEGCGQHAAFIEHRWAQSDIQFPSPRIRKGERDGAANGSQANRTGTIRTPLAAGTCR